MTGSAAETLPSLLDRITVMEHQIYPIAVSSSEDEFAGDLKRSRIDYGELLQMQQQSTEFSDEECMSQAKSIVTVSTESIFTQTNEIPSPPSIVAIPRRFSVPGGEVISVPPYPLTSSQ